MPTRGDRARVKTTENRLRQRLEPLIRRGFHLYSRFARGMTLGVRGLVVDGQNRIFLVEHSYVTGWHMPGGGVEVGETLTDALARELAEEGNIMLTGTPALHGMFFNGAISRRDHIAVFVIRAFRQDAPPTPDREDRDVIAPRDGAIEEHAMKRWCASEHDVSLLGKLSS